MSEMIHFIRQTQAYCQVEVIECSWEILYQFIQQKKGDLDSLIGAHRSYLDRIVKKVLLLSHKTGREVGAASFAVTYSDTLPRKAFSIKCGSCLRLSYSSESLQFVSFPSRRTSSDGLDCRIIFITIACLNLLVGMLCVT